MLDSGRMEKVTGNFVLEVGNKKIEAVLLYLQNTLHADVEYFAAPNYTTPSKREVSLIRIDYQYKKKDYMLSIKVSPTYSRGDTRKHYMITNNYQTNMLFNNLYELFKLGDGGDSEIEVSEEEPEKEEITPPVEEETDDKKMETFMNSIATLISYGVLMDQSTIIRNGNKIRVIPDNSKEEDYYEVDISSLFPSSNEEELNEPIEKEEEIKEKEPPILPEEPVVLLDKEIMKPVMLDAINQVKSANEKLADAVRGHYKYSDPNGLIEEQKKRVVSLGSKL